MNLSDLFIPADHAKLFSDVYGAEKASIGENELAAYLVPESILVKLFIELGAVSKAKMNESIHAAPENELLAENDCQIAVDEQIGYVVPEVILDVMEKEGINILKAIFQHGNLSLKEVAEAYGGKSAAANLANFMARTNDELANMRRSTIVRISEAMEIPPEWILSFLQTD